MGRILIFVDYLFKEARHNVWSLFYAKGGQTARPMSTIFDKEPMKEISMEEKGRNELHFEMEKLALKHYDSMTTFTSSASKQQQERRQKHLSNPFTAFKALTLHNWLTFYVAWLALYADFLDSIMMVICIPKLSLYFKISKTEFTTAITLTLLFRPIGGVLFGLLSDLKGRRWPLAIDLALLGCFQIASIFAKPFSVFLFIRVLASICIGGFYGMTSQIYDNAPAQTRGILGGLLHCAICYAGVTAAGLNMSFGDSPDSFKKMFWVGVGITFFASLLRALLPESPQFRKMDDDILIGPGEGKYRSKIRRFVSQFRMMFSQSWPIFIYCTIFVSLNAWINGIFSANYFVFLMSEKGFSNKTASVVLMLCAIGTIFGMILGGALSQVSFFGRRRMAVLCAVSAFCLMPAAILPNTAWGLALGCNFFYMFLHGYSGIMHSHLNELSPCAFRAFFTGTVQQLGTMFAAPATQIATAIADSHHIKGPKGNLVEAYSPTIAVGAAICLFLKVIWVSIGPEHRDADIQNFTPAVKMGEMGERQRR